MPSSAAVAPSSISNPRFQWAGLNYFADLKVRSGMKAGLAAVLALWVAQLLRLEHPNWSVLAVLVLTSAHYVGAIATKAMTRAIGTIVGALLGIWVVGDYANTPLAFILLVFTAVAISTYKSGQIASAAWPYAYYLMGLTLVSAATYAITDPGDVWRIALSRTLETLVGVASATLVYSILWPRYSREEFAALASETVKTVRALLGAEARAYAGEAVNPGRVLDLRRVFSGQIIALRSILVAGGRGSVYFRARLGNYQRFVVSMTHLFQALLELQKRRAEEDPILDLIRAEMDRFLSALDRDLGVLSGIASAERGLPPIELNAAFSELEARVKTLREQGVFRRAPVAAGETFFGHHAALRQLRDEINLLHQLAGELPRLGLPFAPPNKRRSILPAIDGFWVRQGVKAGLSTCLAFLLIKWIHPPGATAIPLGAWIFSAMGRSSVSTGGVGDMRAFQRMFLTAVSGIPVVALLWLVMPLLAQYWAMNLLLFALCYAFGSVTAESASFGYAAQLMLLAISTLVAINPQQPVAFDTLKDSFLGLLIGLVIGGVVGRVLWPVLPQTLLHRNLTRFFVNLRALLGGSEDREYVFTETVLLPLEAIHAVDSIALPRCPASERDDLGNFIRTAHPLGMQITTLHKVKSKPLPAKVETLLRAPLAALEAKFGEFLDSLASSFRPGNANVVFPDFRVEMEAVESQVNVIRDDGLVANEDIESVAHMLELLDRYHVVAERLLSCRDQLTKLSLHRYLGDVAL
jgi:uncharacterized membrane protein YccC